MRAHLFGFGALLVTVVSLVACEVHMNDGKPTTPATGAAPPPAPAPGPAPTPGGDPAAATTAHAFNPNRGFGVDPTPVPPPTPAATDAGGATVSVDGGSVVVNGGDAGSVVVNTGDGGSNVSITSKKKIK